MLSNVQQSGHFTGDTTTRTGAVQLHVTKLSDEEMLSSSSGEDKTFVGQAVTTNTKSADGKPSELKSAPPQAPATKVLFRLWNMVLLRAVEGLLIALMLSVLFQGLLFDWVMANPAPPPNGFPFISVFMASILVIEVIRPSCVSTMFEWSVLRYWGKISFSIYLLHTFVVKYPAISHQPKYFNRLFARLFLVIALATVPYHLIEYPSQLMAQWFSRYLAAQMKKGSSSLKNNTSRSN